MSIKITVVIPLYNKSEHISRCLQSVKNQVTPVDEVIIINDGSTDASSEIASGFICENKLTNFRLVDQPNKGVSFSRNRGAGIARNEYICFLDADDEWYEDHLTRISKLISDFPNAVLYGTAHHLKKDEQSSVAVISSAPRGYIDDFFAASIGASVVNSSKVCLKRTEFKVIGGFPEGAISGEDFYVWTMMALNWPVAYDPAVTVRINQDADINRRGRAKTVPYIISYFSRNKSNRIMNPSLKRYLRRIILAHLVDSIRNNDYVGWKIRWRSSLSLFPGYVMLLTPLVLVPRRVFDFFGNK